MPTKEVSDKDVEKSREQVEKTRLKLDAAEQELAVSEAARNNATIKEGLDNENARLEAELAATQEKIKTSKGAESPLADSEPEVVDTTPPAAEDPKEN